MTPVEEHRMAVRVAIAWLHGLTDNPMPEGMEIRPMVFQNGRRGLLAEFRRAQGAMGIMLTPAFGILVGRVETAIGRTLQDRDILWLARSAQVLRHADGCSSQSRLGRAFGATKPGSDTPVVSAVRFRTLLDSANAAEAADYLETLLPILAAQSPSGQRPWVNADEVLWLLSHWDDAKARLATDYYAASLAAAA